MFWQILRIIFFGVVYFGVTILSNPKEITYRVRIFLKELFDWSEGEPVQSSACSTSYVMSDKLPKENFTTIFRQISTSVPAIPVSQTAYAWTRLTPTCVDVHKDIWAAIAKWVSQLLLFLKQAK